MPLSQKKPTHWKQIKPGDPIVPIDTWGLERRKLKTASWLQIQEQNDSVQDCHYKIRLRVKLGYNFFPF